MFAAGSLGEIAIPGGKNETLFDPRNILGSLLFLSSSAQSQLLLPLALSFTQLSQSWVMVVEWGEEERWRRRRGGKAAASGRPNSLGFFASLLSRTWMNYMK